MSKYYTPKDTEFHKGFEYEYYAEPLDEWQPLTFEFTRYVREIDLALKQEGETTEEFLSRANKEKLGKLIEYPNSNNFTWLKTVKTRVKYLDSSDIGDLGFEQVISTENGWFNIFKNGISLQLQYLNRSDLKGTIKITQLLYDEASPVVFWGLIKNKAELKIILNQIGVLEDD